MTWIKYIFLFGGLVPAMINAQTSLNELILDEELETAHVGFCVTDIASGEIIASHKAGKLFTPASTLKLLTGYTALKTLGPQYAFYTQVAYQGSLKSDTLYGDILLIGGGDPTLGSDKFLKSRNLDELLNLLQDIITNTGIIAIQGDILMYNGRYNNAGEQDKWPYEDIGNYYGAGAHSINIHENQYTIEFQRSNRSGKSTEIYWVFPPLDSISFINKVRTGPSWSGDQAYIFGTPFTWKRQIRGTIPAGTSHFTIDGSLPFPAYNLGVWLKNKLAKAGISVSGNVEVLEVAAPEDRENLGAIASPPLIDIVKEMNERSVNLYAEALLKEIGLYTTGVGDTEHGISAVYEALPELKGKSNIVDGSGLSPFDGITPLAYCRFLASAVNDDEISDAFIGSLAIYGRTGTLRYVLDNTYLENRARGKSGSLSGVRAYTGILVSAHGRHLAFSFFLNKFHGSWSQVRPKFEKLLVEIAKKY